MTKELKEELVKMDWREVIAKRKQIKDKSRQKPQTRMAGGNPNLTPRKERTGSPFDETDEDKNERMLLASATREDLMDKVMDMIGSMSEDELIDLLMTSQGEVEVRDIGVTNRRG